MKTVDIAVFLALTIAPALGVAQAVQPPVSASYKEVQWLSTQTLAPATNSDWWMLYHDTRLNDLEQELGASNLELKVAESRFQQARSLIRMNRASEVPTLAVTPSISNVRDSTNRPYFSRSMANNGSGDFALPFDLSYEVDLWGRIHKMVAAARDQAQASAADLANVRLILEAELAFDYFDIRGADVESVLWRQTIATREQMLSMQQDLFNGGAIPQDDLSTTKEDLEASRVRLQEIVRQRAQDEHAIAVLIGKEPAQFALPAEDSLPVNIPNLSAGVPSVLLERRPDIASQQRLMAAANEQIGIARTAYYPSFMLSAQAGFESTSIWNWMNWPSRFWSIGGQITQTLFDGGHRKANASLAQEQYEATVANYRQTVLLAFQEVEDQLATLRDLSVERDHQSAATHEAEQRFSLASARYEGGIGSPQSVFSAQLQIYADQLALTDLHRRRLQASVGLIKATGGGWNNARLAAVH